ncbi:MAG: MFS transporter [Planctomycetes bacterium]|nr:MFS transporter [Planctomycetota bacterium]
MDRPSPLSPRGRERDPLLGCTELAGRYRLREKLGQGSLGFLYSGDDAEREERVALKALRARWAAPSARAALEARRAQWNAAAEAASGGLLPILDLCVEGEHCVLVSPLFDGEDLYSRIQRAKEGRRKGNSARSVPLPDEHGNDEAARPFGSAGEGDDARRIANVVRFFARAARALGELHRRGFIHGNLKPANLLVDAHGSPWIVDPALAGHAAAVRAGEVPGAIDTFAPEQVDLERGALDARSDVFSLAACLYEALALELPFPGPLRHQTAEQILRAAAPRLDRVLPAIPRALAELVARCLDADPRRRPADGAQLAAELERASGAAAEDASASAAESPDVRRTSRLALPLLACLILIPSTLPVAVLRKLVQERFDVSVFATSWFMALQMIGAFLAAPLAGALSDRLGKRKVFVVVALLLNALLLLAMTQVASFPALLGVRFLDGVTHITALSLLMALAADGAAPAQRGRTMGLVGAGLTLGVTLGASCGGIIGRGDPLRPLQVGAALSILAAIACSLLLREAPFRGAKSGLRAAFGALSRDHALLAPLSFAFVDRFTVGFFTSVFPLWLSKIHNVPVDRIGMLLGAFLVPFALLSYPFGKLSERRSRVALTCWGSAIYGFGAMSLGLWSPEVLALPMVFLGICSAVMFVPSLILATDLAGPASKGAAMGAFNAAGSLGFICGPLVGAGVVQLVGENGLGFGLAFVTAGLSEILCVALTLPTLIRLVRSGRTT